MSGYIWRRNDPDRDAKIAAERALSAQKQAAGKAPKAWNHGTVGYDKGCRCVVCSGAKSAHNARQYRRRLAAQGLAMRGKKGTVTHGLRATYTAGCRCTPCTEANSFYQWARQMTGEVPPGGQHGLSGYNSFGCRCEVCRAAKSVSNAARYRAVSKAKDCTECDD